MAGFELSMNRRPTRGKKIGADYNERRCEEVQKMSDEEIHPMEEFSSKE
jgi:hypothetical protein